MAKQSRESVKNARMAKKAATGRVVKEKFVDSVQQGRKPLLPLNERQKEYIEAIKTTSFTICLGVWGSAKSFIPATIAADMLMDKKIEKVIIARPNEGKGKSIGLLPGDKNA